MSKKQYILLAALQLVAALHAHEFRVPLPRNTFGYDFDPRAESGWVVDVSGAAYSRHADRAFAKHGTATNNLSALFFNKDTFRLAQAFPSCLVGLNTEYYNPYVRVLSMSPRVQYNEHGTNLSMSISRDVFKEKGRWGMRARMPFRCVDMRRTDRASRHDSQTQDVARSALNQNTESGLAYRLDFLEAMPKVDRSSSQVAYDTKITFFEADGDDGKVAAVYRPEGYAPRPSHVGVDEDTVDNASTPKVPATLDGLDSTKLYAFSSSSYGNLRDEDAPDVATRVANQDKKARVWVSTSHGTLGTSDATENISNNIPRYISAYNANTEEWLHDRGFTMESSRQIGLGDMEVEFFYDHHMTDRIVGGLWATLVLPTAYGSQFNDNDYAGNPFRAHLGNGGHVEAGVGAKIDMEAFLWLNLHADANYMWAIDGNEWRAAVPVGSLIKGIGPRHEADVSWGRLVSNLEMHFCHPHTTDISGMIGYQFVWKGSDTVRYKQSAVDAWLGKAYSTDNKDYTVANSMTLDNELAAAQTEQYAHRLRCGLTYHFSDWFTLSAGSAFTFAGQYVPKAFDLYASVRVVL